MKKAYVKPALYAEEFTLAEHIANCVNIVHFGPECGPYDINGMTLFNNNCGGEGTDNYNFWAANDVDPAKVTFEDMEAKGLQCYTTYVSLSTIFQS